MLEKSRLVPLDEVSHEAVNLNLSFIPPDIRPHIGVDIARLASRSQFSGIRHLNIKGTPVSRPITSVVGMDENGAAYAGQVKAPATENEQQIVDKNAVFKNSCRIDLSVILDELAIQHSVSMMDGGVRSPRNWANELDQIIRNEVYKKGQNHLTDLGRNEQLFFTGELAIGGAGALTVKALDMFGIEKMPAPVYLRDLLLKMSEFHRMMGVDVESWNSAEIVLLMAAIAVGTVATRNILHEAINLSLPHEDRAYSRFGLLSFAGIEIDRAVIFAMRHYFGGRVINVIGD